MKFDTSNLEPLLVEVDSVPSTKSAGAGGNVVASSAGADGIAITLVEQQDSVAFPTSQRQAAKNKKKESEEGKTTEVRRRPQVVEQHFDDCET